MQDDLPGVYIDFEKFQRILCIVLDNSVTFNVQEGEVVIEVSKDGDSNIAIEVRDTGIGISQSDLKNIVDAFEYAGDIMKKSYKGLGIGLAIAHNLLAMHSAALSIESKQGVGTKVKIVIPASRTRVI